MAQETHRLSLADLDKLSDRELILILVGDVSAIHQDLLRLAPLSERVQTTLYGNGEPGLDEAVRILKRDIRVRDRLLSAVLGTVLVLVFGFLFQVFTGQASVVFP